MAPPPMLSDGTKKEDQKDHRKADQQLALGPYGRFPVGDLGAVNKCCDKTGHDEENCTISVVTDFR